MRTRPVTGGTDIPLRVRLIAWVGSVLLVSLGCGSALVVWHARQVGADGTARGARRRNARYPERPCRPARRPAPPRRTFDGNRHVRALLLDDQDRLVAASSLTAPTRKAPGWFRRLIADVPAVVRVTLPQAGDAAAIVLQADPTSEISEVRGNRAMPWQCWPGSRC